jgi:hypothetical protein
VACAVPLYWHVVAMLVVVTSQRRNKRVRNALQLLVQSQRNESCLLVGSREEAMGREFRIFMFQNRLFVPFFNGGDNDPT